MLTQLAIAENYGFVMHGVDPGRQPRGGGEKDAGRICVFEAFLTVIKVWTTCNDMTRIV